MIEAKGIDLVAASDLSTDQLDDFKRRRNVTALYTDYREMIAKEQPDIVSVTTRAEERADVVMGMTLVVDGQIVDVAEDPVDWPYQTVLEAIRDGWHVIQFPNLALLMDESRTYGLGCEFVLEKVKPV